MVFDGETFEIKKNTRIIHWDTMRKAGNDPYRPIDFKLNEILLF
jgi:hypothetical protein